MEKNRGSIDVSLNSQVLIEWYVYSKWHILIERYDNSKMKVLIERYGRFKQTVTDKSLRSSLNDLYCFNDMVIPKLQVLIEWYGESKMNVLIECYARFERTGLFLKATVIRKFNFCEGAFGVFYRDFFQMSFLIWQQEYGWVTLKECRTARKWVQTSIMSEQYYGFIHTYIHCNPFSMCCFYPWRL